MSASSGIPVRRGWVAAIVTIAVIISLGILMLTPAMAQTGPTVLGRTPWQMLRIPSVLPLPGPLPGTPSYIHGDVRLYNFAPPVPAANDPGWGPAPNGDTIGFGHGNFSRIDEAGYGCFRGVDFTFFQTFVDIPLGTTLSTFTISFSGMDDGSRITIFNSLNPGGLVVPGSYVFLGGSGTANLAPHVVAGERNRVVITQVDDCPVGNQLSVARVVLNGQVVPPAPLNQPPTCQGPVLINIPEDTSVTQNLASQCSDPDVGDTILIEIVSLNLTSVNPVPPIGPLPHTLPTGDITLTPDLNYNGPGGSFQFRAKDNKGAFGNVVTANVTVSPVNDAPTVSLAGPTSVDEGGVLTFTYTVSDADNDPLFFQILSCDSGNHGIGSFNGPPPINVSQPTGTFECRYSDGTIHNIVADIQVNDPSGAWSDHGLVNVTVNNVAPTATLNAPASVIEGSEFTVSLTGAFDPSGVDITAGLRYSFDCGSGFGPPGPANLTTCTAGLSGSVTVKGKVQDKDGGSNTYSQSVTITLPPQPAFSRSVQPPPGACICTPLMMNTNVGGIEHWWVKSDGSGTLALTATAHSVNSSAPETLVARIYPASGAGPALLTLTASYPAGTPAGTEVSDSGSIVTTPDTVYLVRITTPAPTPPTQPHYSLKIHGATLAAVKSPTFASLEPHQNVRWLFPLGASPEDLQIRLFNDGTPISPPPPSGVDPLIVDVRVFAPAFVLVAAPPALTFPNPPGTFDTTVSAAVPAGPGFATLDVQNINTHYRIERTTGTDRDVYLNWATFGRGDVTGSIVNGGGVPFTGSVQVTLKAYPSGPTIATQTTSTGSFVFHNVRVGRYIVEIVPPPGATPLGPLSINNVFVTCDGETRVRFELTSGVAARTIGYWKNHQDHLAQMLAYGPIDLGDTVVTTAAQAVTVLSNASAQDARDSLRAQLLAAILNLRNDANPFAAGADIRPTVGAATAYLDTHSSPVTGRHPDRASVLAMKDLLDAFNNSGE